MMNKTYEADSIQDIISLFLSNNSPAAICNYLINEQIIDLLPAYRAIVPYCSAYVVQ